MLSYAVISLSGNRLSIHASEMFVECEYVKLTTVNFLPNQTIGSDRCVDKNAL